MPEESIFHEPDKALLLLHMWKDYPHTVTEPDIASILAATLGLSPMFVRGFMDGWNYHMEEHDDIPDYASGWECGMCRPEIEKAAQAGLSRN